MKARSLREEQVEADRVIEALDAAIKSDGELLTEKEQGQIAEARTQLVEIRSGQDPEAIKQAIKNLESACADFVARRMNTSIQKAMKGHTIDEYASDES